LFLFPVVKYTPQGRGNSLNDYLLVQIELAECAVLGAPAKVDLKYMNKKTFPLLRGVCSGF
jgi:hypothetical protein